MNLNLAADAIATIRSCGDAYLLGIILQDGTVRLQVADHVLRPGHVAWMRRDGINGAVRGFGLMVRSSRVTAMFCQSELNAACGDYSLELQYVEGIERLLSDDLGVGYRRW